MSIINPCIMIVSSGVILENWTWRLRLIARSHNGCYIVSYIGMLQLMEVISKLREKEYSVINIWEASKLLLMGLCASVNVQDILVQQHWKFCFVFQDIHIVQQIFATRPGMSCLGCVLPWWGRVLIPYSTGNIETFWRYFDQNGLHSYSPVFNKATRGLAFGRILHIYFCHSDAK